MPKYNNRMQYEIGSSYFRFTFIDNEFNFPEILSYVFIGKNLDSNDKGLWYFQDSVSYANGVLYKGDTKVCVKDEISSKGLIPNLLVLKENQLNTFCNIDNLIDKLTQFKLGIKVDQWGKTS